MSAHNINKIVIVEKIRKISGPSCSRITMLLVTVSLKF